VDGSLLGDELSDGTALLGSLLGINERLGRTDGSLLGAADLMVGAELEEVPLGAAGVGLGVEDGSAFGAMVGSNESDAVGLGDTLGADDGELVFAIGFEDLVGPVDGAEVGAGGPEVSELGPVLAADDKVGEGLGSMDGGFDWPLGFEGGLMGLGISVGPVETVTDGVERGLELGELVGLVDTSTAGEEEGLALDRSFGSIEFVADGGAEGRLLFLGFVNGVLLGETVAVGLPLPDMLGCGEMVGVNVGPNVGLVVASPRWIRLGLALAD
jgi:hypothetical protein